jgi:hypothetical protein
LYLPDQVEKPTQHRIAALVAGLPSPASPEELRQLLLPPLAECFRAWLRLRWQDRPPLDRVDAARETRWLAHEFVVPRSPAPYELDLLAVKGHCLADSVLPAPQRGLYRGAKESLSTYLVDAALPLLDEIEFRLQGKPAEAQATPEAPTEGEGIPVSWRERVCQAIEQALADPDPGAAIDGILRPLGWNRAQWASAARVDRTRIYHWIIRRGTIGVVTKDKLINALEERWRKAGI